MPQVQHVRFKVARTAHCYVMGPTDGTATELWIACHGYGQLAKHFICRFDVVQDDHRLIVAPQGLSLYYTKGLNKQPGASWMTRENRLDEIEDYATWLQIVYGHFVGQCASCPRIILFGFSQGCATVMRWIVRCRPHFDVLMLWAGLTPEDIDYKPLHPYFAERQLWQAWSPQDEFLPTARQQWQHQFNSMQGLNFTYFIYKGGHRLPRHALKQWENSTRNVGP